MHCNNNNHNNTTCIYLCPCCIQDGCSMAFGEDESVIGRVFWLRHRVAHHFIEEHGHHLRKRFKNPSHKKCPRWGGGVPPKSVPTSAIEEQEVGWPDLLAVVILTEWILSLWARSCSSVIWQQLFQNLFSIAFIWQTKQKCDMDTDYRHRQTLALPKVIAGCSSESKMINYVFETCSWVGAAIFL